MEDMITGVHAALAGRKEVDPRDVAAEALALTYAGLMDEAAPAGKYRKALAVLHRAVAGMGTEDDDAIEAFQTVATALAEHSVASDLGPKLLATLDKLGLTTQARGSAKAPGVNNAAKDPLTVLREERAARLGGAGARVPR